VLPARVLLLDDELEIREAMTGLLRSHSVDAHAVADEAAAEALRRAAAKAGPSTCCCATTGWPMAPTGSTPACA
jgi:CheY-like chemotaxis protein